MAKDTKKLTDELQSKKVAIYIRVSTHWQVDKDSLQVQKRELVAYAEMVLGITDYTVFEDPGFSAKNTDRPDYQRMMARLRTGEYSHLLVWKIDRISRNLLDFAAMYKELKDLGVVFVSKNEQFDTSNAIGEAMLKIILVFAELERNMTSERVTAVMLSRAENGQWNGGRVPFGYHWDKETKSFSVVYSEAEVVKKIFSRYEEKQSLIGVARSLNDEGYTTRLGKPWSVAVIHEMLTSHFYIGQYRYNTHEQGDRYKEKDEAEWIVIENHHEPIINDVQFDRVQFILKRNWRGGYKRGESHLRKNIHIFAGLVKCGNCGNNMSATLDKRRANGLRPSIYGCATRRGNKSKCGNKFVSDVYIGPFVFNYIANIIRAKETITESTGISVLEKRLLRGNMFEDVYHIGNDSLKALREILLSGKTGMEFKPASVFENNSTTSDELSLVLERKRKTEIALNRLKSLYLYGEAEIPEKDFVIARQKLLDTISECNEKITALTKTASKELISSEDFLQKASYFIMVEKLLEGRTVDYEKYILGIEPEIPRNFIVSIIDRIEITNGRITSILFRNGILHTFHYRN